MDRREKYWTEEAVKEYETLLAAHRQQNGGAKMVDYASLMAEIKKGKKYPVLKAAGFNKKQLKRKTSKLNQKEARLAYDALVAKKSSRTMKKVKK